MKKMQFLAAAVALGLSMCAVGVANAAYPEDKDITVIIPKNPGGGTDITARGLITMMQQDLGNANFVPQNKPDGNGIVGMVDVANAKPDGYTLGMVTVELDIFPHQGKTKLTYDQFDSVIAPIAAPAALIVLGENVLSSAGRRASGRNHDGQFRCRSYLAYSNLSF